KASGRKLVTVGMRDAAARSPPTGAGHAASVRQRTERLPQVEAERSARPSGWFTCRGRNGSRDLMNVGFSAIAADVPCRLALLRSPLVFSRLLQRFEKFDRALGRASGRLLGVGRLVVADTAQERDPFDRAGGGADWKGIAFEAQRLTGGINREGEADHGV